MCFALPFMEARFGSFPNKYVCLKMFGSASWSVCEGDHLENNAGIIGVESLWRHWQDAGLEGEMGRPL